MRKLERKMEDAQAIELLKKGEYGVLSTTGANGYAYAVPLSYAYLDNAIYFHCATEGQKLYNIKINDKISFCVVGETEVIPDKFTTKFESVIVFGRAVIVDNEEKQDGLMALVDKYSKDFLDKGKAYVNSGMNKTTVFKIIIEHFTGKCRY